MAEAEAGSPRTMIGLLLSRDLGLLTCGKFFSATGVWVHAAIAAIAVYTVTHSTLAVGLLSVALFGPQLILTPLSGTWADRGYLKRQLLLGRILCCASGGFLWCWLTFVRPTGWSMAVVVLSGSLVLGLGFAIGGPAMQSVIPALVSREELRSAMALNTAPGTAARFVGPALGALIVVHHSPATGFAIASIGDVFFAAALGFIRVPPGEPQEPGVDYTVRAGLRHVRNDRPLLLLLGAVAAVGAGSEPTLTLAPALADEFGGGAIVVGLLAAAFGLGALMGLITTAWLSRALSVERSVSTGLGTMAAGIALSASVSWLTPTLIGFALAGAGFSISMTSIGTAVQMRAPTAFRGRIMALWMVGFIGSRPLAALVVGASADLLSVRVALALMAAVPLLAMYACRPARLSQPPPDVPRLGRQNLNHHVVLEP